MFNIRKIQEKAIYEAVEKNSDATIAKEVVYGVEDSAKNESDGEWVKATMNRLENKFENEEIKCIRRGCQCGFGMDEKVALLQELKSQTSNLEELGNAKKVHEAGLFYKDGSLYLQFPFCPCPMLTQVDKLETNTWCLCTTGYSKVLFEKVFSCEFEVELLKSIKMGDDCCLMEIIPKGDMW